MKQKSLQDVFKFKILHVFANEWNAANYIETWLLIDHDFKHWWAKISLPACIKSLKAIKMSRRMKDKVNGDSP